MDPEELKAAIKALQTTTGDALKATTTDVKALLARMDEIEKKMGRPGALAPSPGDSGASPAERKALNAALRKYIAQGDDSELKGMSVGNDPAGGYLVLPQMSPGINKIARDRSPIRRLARIVEITESDTWEEILDTEDAGSGWVGEMAARPETDSPTPLRKASIPTKEGYAAPKVTQKLLDDAADVGTWLEGKIGDRIGEMSELSFVTGDGVAKPRGFATYPTAATADATRAWGTIEHVATGTSAGFGTAPNGSDKLVDLTYATKAAYRQNGSWLMSSLTAGAVRKLKDAEGRYNWQDSLAAGQPPLLVGYPVEIDENMPAIGADSLSIGFGDWRRFYTIVDRIGMKILRDPYTNKPHVIFYAYFRVGGDVVDFNAVKFLKFGTS